MGMMDVAEMRRLARVQRFDFWIALVAIVATLLVGVLAGVVVGVILSLLWLIGVTTHPQLPELGRQRGTTAYRDVSAHPEDLLDLPSPFCGSTAGSSSPAARPWRTVSETSSTLDPSCADWCSTARA